MYSSTAVDTGVRGPEFMCCEQSFSVVVDDEAGPTARLGAIKVCDVSVGEETERDVRTELVDNGRQVQVRDYSDDYEMFCIPQLMSKRTIHIPDEPLTCAALQPCSS